MSIDDIPVFRPARAGQIVRSDDWNTTQRLVRNAVRQHRHSRIADDNDATPEDNAAQIAADEIADGAVTAPKIAAGAVTRTALDPGVVANIDAANAGIASGTATATAGHPLQVTHGLGRRPVAILLAQSSAAVPGLNGQFDIFGGAFVATVSAAVPVTPDGSFSLVTTSATPVAVRWCAIAIKAG